MSELTKEPSKPARASNLGTGRERFLAHVIEHGFDIGRRTPEDFVRHFPPAVIMEGLKNQPRLRSSLLVATTGVKERVALKKNWESAGQDLQIALDEGETDAKTIVSLLEMDDRVRYLDHKALWSYVTEGDFWKISPSRQKEYSAAKSHMAFMLARALEDRLLTHADIVEGITVEELASRLPKSELGKIIKGALDCGKRNAPFTEADLLGSMPPDTLVNYLPLFQVWDAIIDLKIAVEHGYAQPSAKNPSVPAASGWDVPTLSDDKAVATSLFESEGTSTATEAPADTEAEPLADEDSIELDASALGVPPTSKTGPMYIGLDAQRDKAARGKDKPRSSPLKSRPTPPPPLPGASLKHEDPQTWSQEFEEDTEFVDAADLLDEEPTINSKGGPLKSKPDAAETN
jgi:hypothetical protein